MNIEGEFYDGDPDELRREIQSRLSEAPPIPCGKCDVNTAICFATTSAGFEIVSVCPKCGESFVVMECRRVVVNGDAGKGTVH